LGIPLEEAEAGEEGCQAKGGNSSANGDDGIMVGLIEKIDIGTWKIQ